MRHISSSASSSLYHASVATAAADRPSLLPTYYPSVLNSRVIVPTPLLCLRHYPLILQSLLFLRRLIPNILQRPPHPPTVVAPSAFSVVGLPLNRLQSPGAISSSYSSLATSPFTRKALLQPQGGAA
ncbi:hypothetical protein B296_00002201 [Ensete ventricosum]|uniref:Uncharacterized protein n=1 Tax=Ensete ventricosum TaxID=4639 RepID=A0A427BAE4_ENSVE|nr:hypothetical protein B296_00002201 [Ensete ventricosum]